MKLPWLISAFSQGALGPSRAILGSTLANLVTLGGSGGPRGHFLEALWGHFRAMLGPFGGTPWDLIGVVLKTSGGLAREHLSLC